MNVNYIKTERNYETKFQPNYGSRCGELAHVARWHSAIRHEPFQFTCSVDPDSIVHVFLDRQLYLHTLTTVSATSSTHLTTMVLNRGINVPLELRKLKGSGQLDCLYLGQSNSTLYILICCSFLGIFWIVDLIIHCNTLKDLFLKFNLLFPFHFMAYLFKLSVTVIFMCQNNTMQ